MATKLSDGATVTRVLNVEVTDSSGVPRPVVVELTESGTATVRLQGMRRVVNVDLLAAIDHASSPETCEHAVVTTEQAMTANKRTLKEHFIGM